MAEFNLGPFRIKARGKFNSETAYKFLDMVTYNGGSYININYDTIDGISCVGVLPDGDDNSKNYWQCIASKGDKGDIADQYQPFAEVSDGAWDYTVSDKITIPLSAPDRLDITNVYDGCCGIILTKKDLTLPINSLYSVDYNYINTTDDDYYFYTFVYTNIGSDSFMFVWHRSVVNRG